MTNEGSSPLTRGSGVTANALIASIRFIPAYAGFCFVATLEVDSCRVHPRLRGVL